jgi:hypothetical protein
VRRDDAVLLDPEPVDVVLEPQARGKEGRQAGGVVVASDPAVHAPVHVRNDRTKVHQHVDVVQRLEAGLAFVVKEHVDEVDRVDVVRARAERLCHLHDGVVGDAPALQHERVLAREAFRRVRLEVGAGIDEKVSALVVLGHLRDRLAEDVEEGRQDVEGLLRVAVLPGLPKPAVADLVVAERLGARLHERVWPHVVVVAHEDTAERVHQRVVSVSAVARPEQVLHERLQLPVLQPAVQEREELLLLPRPDVEEVVVGRRLFEDWIVLFVVRGARVVENDDRYRVSVAPEVLVVLLHGLADVTQSIGRNDEIEVLALH